MNIEIRKETPQDYYETEAMTRRSFYNVYYFYQSNQDFFLLFLRP